MIHDSLEPVPSIFALVVDGPLVGAGRPPSKYILGLSDQDPSVAQAVCHPELRHQALNATSIQ